MAQFNLVEPIKLKRIDGELRYYETPDGNHYPSITTILSQDESSKEAIQKWRDRIGHDEADKESKRCSDRGTEIHNAIENHFLGKELKFTNKLNKFLFKKILKKLKNIDKIYGQELSLYSDKLKIAGTVDCIAEYNGVLSIIVYKTSTKDKKLEWITNYFVQTSAYSWMFKELYNIDIKQIVILITTEEGINTQIFKGLRNDYNQELKQAILNFRNKYGN